MWCHWSTCSQNEQTGPSYKENNIFHKRFSTKQLHESAFVKGETISTQQGGCRTELAKYSEQPSWIQMKFSRRKKVEPFNTVRFQKKRWLTGQTPQAKVKFYRVKCRSRRQFDCPFLEILADGNYSFWWVRQEFLLRSKLGAEKTCNSVWKSVKNNC